MLQEIHRNHLGLQGCQKRAKESLYWPGMMTQIQERIE